jgi:hypothetical protein
LGVGLVIIFESHLILDAFNPSGVYLFGYKGRIRGKWRSGDIKLNITICIICILWLWL